MAGLALLGVLHATAFMLSSPIVTPATRGVSPQQLATGVSAAYSTVPALVPALDDVARCLRGAAAALTLRRSLGVPAEDIVLSLVSPEAFWMLREWRTQTFGEQEAMIHPLAGVREQIHAMLTQGDGHPVLARSADVTVRSKGLWSTFHKAAVRGKAVHDVLAVRVVLPGGDEHDCYEALRALRVTWPSVGPDRFKDYVRFPKANGYQGLHDTLRLPNGRPFELQIRTADMHTEAEFGTAAHRRYKQGPALLAQTLLSGIVSGLSHLLEPGDLRWPLQPHAALKLATRLVADAPH